MPSRRTRLRLLLVVALSTLVCAAAYLAGRHLLQHNGIERLDWQGLSLSGEGLALERLTLEQRSAAGNLALNGEGLLLTWRDFGLRPPFWQHLSLQRLALHWQPAASAQAAPDEPLRLDTQPFAGALGLLPRSLQVRQLQATLPCARGECNASGDVDVRREADRRLLVRLHLDHGQQRIGVILDLQPQGDALALQAVLAVDQQPQATLDSSLQPRADGLSWQGQLDAQALDQAALLQDWLSAWALPAGAQWPTAPGEVALRGTWRLDLPRRVFELDNLLDARGQLELHGDLPQPWAIPGLGQLQGSLALAARSETGQWLAERLQADLHLSQPSDTWLQHVPAALRGESLHLRVQPDTPLDDLRPALRPRSLPLRLAVALRGATRLDLQGRLALASAAPWAVQVADVRLTSNTARLEQAGWRATTLRSDLRLAGYADASTLELALAPGSQLQAASLQGSDLHLQQAVADIGGSTLGAGLRDGALQAWRLQGPLNLASQRLQQANLHPQGWRWQGRLDVSEQSGRMNGTLSNDSDLRLDLEAVLAADTLRLKATLGELFLRSGNPLAKTLAQWPALLDLNDGRLGASALLTLATAGGAPSIALDLNGKGLGGIYDRSELSGLDTRLHLALARQRLDLDLQQFDLQQANPGLPIGPLQLRGRYAAALDAASQGQLQLSLAHTDLMGGRVALAPGRWDLAANAPLFPLQVRGLQLQQLFALYPAEGLAGSGALDGDLPLRLGADGIQIAQGRIAARPPGGRLQFHSEKIRALGRSNPAMQLVAQSLEDFNFTTLSSSVDYDQHGKLTLGMRLEGQNPAIENGRPIHFNINLEEDIPALLASLQLTDRVNEIITRRVQQRLLQRDTAPKTP